MRKVTPAAFSQECVTIGPKADQGFFDLFAEFYSAKAPTSAAEFNAVAVYFLVHAAGINRPTFDQVYTCYKDVGRRTPEFFKQSVIDTKNKQAWIDLTDDGHVEITHRGTEFVEHDLPKTNPAKSERKNLGIRSSVAEV